MLPDAFEAIMNGDVDCDGKVIKEGDTLEVVNHIITHKQDGKYLLDSRNFRVISKEEGEEE